MDDPEVLGEQFYQELMQSIPQVTASAAGAGSSMLVSSGGRVLAVVEGVGQLINPKLIRYTQDSARAFFQDDRSVIDLSEGLKAGEVLPESIPPIRIFEKDGLLWTLDNRRLAAFELAGADVPYTYATSDEIAAEAWKFTTSNNGTWIRIRGLNMTIGGR